MIWTTSPEVSPSSWTTFGSIRAIPRPTSLWRASATRRVAVFAGKSGSLEGPEFATRANKFLARYSRKSLNMGCALAQAGKAQLSGFLLQLRPHPMTAHRDLSCHLDISQLTRCEVRSEQPS